MSQPEIIGHDPYQTPLKSIDQLVLLFSNNARPKAEVLIGIEYEMFGQIDDGKRPLPYEGPVSIIKYFTELMARSKNTDDPFLPINEGENLVGLTGKRAIIALEPGGQIEIAARPHHSLENATKILVDLVSELTEAASSLGIKLFALGLHPKAEKEDMAVVKKARYNIMREHMQGFPGHGLDMMTRSSAVQINLDYEDEQDFVRKTRLGAALTPFLSLLSTSSAFKDGRPSRFAIERGNVWRTTDPLRTGIPALIFSSDFGYSSWINMVLDVPMYFIRRGQVYHDARNASFREFMTHGLFGHRASVRDFIDHLSTVFTDVRLKPIIELRSADSLPVPYVNAIAAFCYALFYDNTAHAEACTLFADVTHQEIVALQNNAIDKGRSATLHGRPIFSWAAELLRLADVALKDQNLAHLLAPLQNLITRDITCAEWILGNFAPLNDINLKKLIESFAPLNDPLQ